MASIAAADCVFSFPKIANGEVQAVEVGSSPSLTLKFTNSMPGKVQLQSIELFIEYDPGLIDAVIDVRNENPGNFVEANKDFSVPGQIIYKLQVPAASKPLLVPAAPAGGSTVNLATVILHLNQSAAVPRAPVSLLRFAKTNQSSVVDLAGNNVIGATSINDQAAIIRSTPPSFSGLSNVGSVNSFGQRNVGNTVLLDWISGGTAAANDKVNPARYFNGKMSYRIFRNTSPVLAGASELSLANEPAHDPGSDPALHLPYTGNLTAEDYVFQDGPGTGIPSDTDPLSDGTIYYYGIAAEDDTSPNPNETPEEKINFFSIVPLDLIPPGEVKQLTAVSDNNSVTLKWLNPPDPDLGGIVIVKNVDKPVALTALQSASAAPPYGDGLQYDVGMEPFGPGNGKVVYSSAQDDLTSEYDDTDVQNGVTAYYRVFTYDRAVAGPPREMGRNYSKGILIKATPGNASTTVAALAVAPTVEAPSGPLNLISAPLTFPNPFSISRDKMVTLQYVLSADANIEVFLIGVDGMRLKRFSFSAGSEGGRAGINKVTWDGRTDQGQLAGNEIYVGTVISRDDNRLLGKFKITVVD